MMTVCPYCGSAKDEIQSWAGWGVDLLSNNVTAPNGEIVHVRPKCAEVFYVLLRGKGRPVLNHAIVDALWGAHSDELKTPNRHIAVYACKLRKILKPHGLQIKSDRRSWRLEAA